MPGLCQNKGDLLSWPCTGLRLNGLLTCSPAWAKPTAAHTHAEMSAGPETSQQESGVPVAELLRFLGREGVSSEPSGIKRREVAVGTESRLCFPGEAEPPKATWGWPAPPAQQQLPWEGSLPVECRAGQLTNHWA